MRIAGQALVALTVILFAQATAAADLAAKPNAYTERDRHRETLEFHRKTLVDAYQQVGNKNPAWDEQAIKFLDSVAIAFSNFGFGAQHQGEARKLEDLIEQGKAVARLGCDDPMVLYCYGSLLVDAGRKDEGKPVLAQAYKGLISSKYSPERIVYGCNRLLKLSEATKERLDITAESDKWRERAITQKAINGAHRRMIADEMWNDWPATSAVNPLKFIEEMKKNNDADQWIVNVFAGRYYVKLAWAARGGGLANQVKAEGWRGFEQNLAKARECLTEAWKLAPNLPEAPAEMITVTMGQGNRGQETIRTWFDRAVEAQFDYGDAYNKLRYALLPRWHGSHEEILALGIECFRTGRYDTGVPYELVDCLRTIRDDRSGDMSLLDKPEIYEMVRDLMVQYANVLKDKPESSSWYLSFAAALANRNGKHEESRKFLEQINDKINEDLYRSLHLYPRISVSESYLLTGPFAKRYTEALQLQKAEKHEQAAAAMQKLIDDMPKDDKGLLNAKFTLETSQRALNLAAGEWVDLSPGADLVPWTRWYGNWSSPKEGELLGVAADRKGMMIISQVTVSTRYEFSAEFEIQKNTEIAAPCVGMVLNFTGPQDSHPGVWLYPNDKKMLLRGNQDKDIEVEVGNTFRLLVRVIDDQATVMLDGRQVAQFNGAARNNLRLGIGLAGMYEMPEAGVVFREIKVRKIKKDGREEK
jgi:tetratricopeptide (TPR) repeat protein